MVPNLVRNPRTPLSISLNMVPRLNPRDLKSHLRRPQRPRGHPQARREVHPRRAAGPAAAGSTDRWPTTTSCSASRSRPPPPTCARRTRKLARERHPDRFPDPAAKQPAQQTFQEITAAFNTLSNDRARAEYDKSLEAPPRPPVPEEIARDAFDRGQKLYEAKNFFDAVELLRVAVAHAPQEARYHAALGRALARNPHWVREGDPVPGEGGRSSRRGSAAYHAELAELLAGQGLRIRARKAAEAALRLDPQHAIALRVMDAVGDDEPPAGDGGGGIRGLLRRKP